eukprot:CAMPEP_0172506414 /NCGR_PEP_ID=MMETSP1066-20121228/194946_1 /TAXON_ID=671091 /ORGANISM="Coscinodiscus wailesii, Strain CCMP2513" /LENGTH=110 /DNA_ID=CAMNT_0013283443 /DNA_START=44 /DNA_END=376 /DNA_ORIENTATION=+
MTIPVPLENLPEQVPPDGSYAFITASDGTSHPRVTHVAVRLLPDGNIRTSLGRSALREIATNKNVTILWPHEELSLIVDGVVEDCTLKDNGTGCVLIRPVRAVKHQRREI